MKKGFLLKKKTKPAPATTQRADAAAASPAVPAAAVVDQEEAASPAADQHAAPATPQVLVIGDTGSHKHHLVNAIHTLATRNPSSALSAGGEAGGAAAVAGEVPSVLPLRTKYYTASVELVVEEVADYGTGAAGSSGTGSGGDSGEGSGEGDGAAAGVPHGQRRDHLVEAAVLVVSARSPASFRSVARAWEQAHKGGDRFPKLDIQLVAVLAEGDGDAAHQAFLDEVFGWAAGAFFEAIVCDVRDPHRGAEGRDKESFARVLQALEAHMWSNLEMLPRGGGGGDGGSGAGGGGRGGRGGGSTRYGTVPADAEPAPAPDPGAGSLAAADSLAAASAASAAEGGDPSSSASASAAAGASSGDDGGDAEAQRRLREFMGEDMMQTGAAAFGDEDSFARVLEKERARWLWKQARQVREQAQRGGITDAQRRRNAADAVAQMLEMLGPDDSETDTDTEPETEVATVAGGDGAAARTDAPTE